MEREWLVSICLKYSLVFFLPLYLVAGQNFSYASVLLALGPEASSFMPYSGSSLNILLPVFIAILTLPALLFDYTVHHRPKGRSVTRLFILVFILLNPYVQVLLLTPIMLALPAVLGGYSELYSMISQAAIFAVMTNTWALPLMVVIPFFVRQVSDFNPFPQMLSKYNMLAIILGMSVFMMPILIANTSPFYFSPYAQQAQPLVLVSGGALFQIVQGVNYVTLIFTTMIFMYLMMLPVATGLYIVFIHDVFEYLKMRTSRARCIGTGVIATFGAVSVFFGPSIMYGSLVYQGGYPLPTILVMGLVVMLRAKKVEVRETIWDNQPEEFWYESKEPISQGGRGDSITVPASYIVRSRFKGANKQKEKYDWGHKDDDVFRQESESHADG